MLQRTETADISATMHASHRIFERQSRLIFLRITSIGRFPTKVLPSLMDRIENTQAQPI